MKVERVKNMVDEGEDRDITLNWKPIVGYEHRYLVSDCGKVWDRKHDREVSQVLSGPNKKRYRYVNLQGDDGRKLVVVHRLVALAFVPRTEEGKYFVDHIDRDSENNHYTNLRWVCPKGNMRNTDKNRKTSTGELIVEVVEKKYGEAQPHLANIYGKMRNYSLSFEDAMFEYDYKRETGQEYSEWIDYIEQKYEAFGSKISMQELVEQYGHDKETVKHKLQTGWTLEEVMSGHKWYDGKYAFLSTHPNCSGKWWPYKARCMEDSGIGDGTWEKAVSLSKDGLIDVVEAKRLFEEAHKKEWVVGGRTYFETFTGLCRLFGKEHTAVFARVEKQGMTLEQALTEEPIRVNWYRFNGILKLSCGEEITYDNCKVKPIQLTGLLGCKSQGFNKKNKDNRSRGVSANLALLDTLGYFGCDTSGLTITVEQQ